MKMIKEYEMKCYEGDEPRINVTKEFVEKNHLKINIQAAKKLVLGDDNDVFGFKASIALNYLSYEDAKAFILDEHVKKIESGEKKWLQITDVYEATQDFLDYMVFAWMKANDERGLSAGRSIFKLSAWMKILDREDIANILEDEDLYDPYGKPALRKCCESLSISCPSYI